MVLFLIKSNISLDPDFGWRLRAGEIYLTHGIPKTDPFTYTMSDFPWVDHAWLTSAVMWSVYNRWGYLCLTIFIVSIGMLSVLISAGSANVKTGYKLIPLVLSFPYLLSFMGVRVQIVTWLFFSLLIYSYSKNALWNKIKFFLPLFFIIWSNLHGGFLSGLFFVFTIFAVEAFKNRSLDNDNVFIFVFSAVSTLFTPYGSGTWREILSSVMDGELKWKVFEWMPAIFVFDISLWFLVSLSTIMLYLTRKSISLDLICLYIFFLIQGLMSRRNMPLWLLFAIPTTSTSLSLFVENLKKDREANRRVGLIIRPFIFSVLIIAVLQSLYNLWGASTVNEKHYYPDKAVNFLINNPPEGEVFSDYGWGGYLIWKFPQKKVFIDGRMPSWRRNSVTYSAFDDYLKIITGELDYKDEFEKYNIDTVLLPLPGREGFYGMLANKISDLLILVGREKRDKYILVDKLEDDGWDMVYKDDKSVIYKFRQ